MAGSEGHLLVSGDQKGAEGGEGAGRLLPGCQGTTPFPRKARPADSPALGTILGPAIRAAPQSEGHVAAEEQGDLRTPGVCLATRKACLLCWVGGPDFHTRAPVSDAVMVRPTSPPPARPGSPQSISLVPFAGALFFFF